MLQLKKLNTRFPVPMLIVNYNGFFDGLKGLFEAFDATRVLQQSELDGLVMVRDNEEAIDYLASFYSIAREHPAT